MRELQVGDIVPREDGPHRVVSIDQQAGTCELIKHDGPEPNSVVWWTAYLEDGTAMKSTEHDSIERVHERGKIQMLIVKIEGRPELVRGNCDVSRGESMHLFTRRAVREVGTPRAHLVNMPVMELRFAAGGFVRTYVHPEHGVFVSSMDLNL